MKPGTKFLHSLFEVAHVEFQTYDLYNHKLLFSSGLIPQLLGYTEDEYVELSQDFYKNILHPDDLDKVQQTINALCSAQKGEVIEMIARLLKRDGNYIWVNSRQMVYEMKPDRHVCTIIREVEDVTSLVALQDQLEEKVEQLKAISFRNSHLVRGPVASIIGLIDIIEEKEITSDHNKQVLRFLKEAISKLDDVILDINDLARLD